MSNAKKKPRTEGQARHGAHVDTSVNDHDSRADGVSPADTVYGEAFMPLLLSVMQSKDLTCAEKLMHSVLLASSADGLKGKSYMKISTIMARSGMSRSWAYEAIAGLVAKGWIVEGPREGDRRSFRFTRPEQSARADTTAPSARADANCPPERTPRPPERIPSIRRSEDQIPTATRDEQQQFPDPETSEREAQSTPFEINQEVSAACPPERTDALADHWLGLVASLPGDVAPRRVTAVERRDLAELSATPEEIAAAMAFMVTEKWPSITKDWAPKAGRTLTVSFFLTFWNECTAGAVKAAAEYAATAKIEAWVKANPHRSIPSELLELLDRARKVAA